MTYDQPVLEPPAQQHSDTSRAAAASVKGIGGKQRQAVMNLLKLHPRGLTDEAMQVLLNMSPNTQRPRRVELVAMAAVEDSGHREKTKAGRKAVVWRAVS